MTAAPVRTTGAVCHPENAARTGRVGVHLACADLTQRGYEAMIAPEGLPYDVLVISRGGATRVQVKTCTRPRPDGGHKGQMGFKTKGAKGDYAASYDVLCLVGLEPHVVGYQLPARQQFIHRRPELVAALGCDPQLFA